MSERAALLGRWYADPLTPAQATALLEQARARRTPHGRRNRRCYTCRLQELVARFWLGESTDDEYLQLQRNLRRTAHGLALLELVYGQLLMSRRLSPARQHLDEGFRLANRLFTAVDYLTTLNRHQLLAWLPLSKQASPAATLTSLLTTARVVARLEGTANRRTPVQNDPNGI